MWLGSLFSLFAVAFPVWGLLTGVLGQGSGWRKRRSSALRHWSAEWSAEPRSVPCSTLVAERPHPVWPWVWGGQRSAGEPAC